MFRIILCFFLLFSKYSFSNYQNLSLILFGRVLVDQVGIILDPSWDNTRHYKKEFLTSGLNLRSAGFDLGLRYKGFGLESGFEIKGSDFFIRELYLDYRTLSKNFDILIGQFSHEHCDFYSDSYAEQPLMEMPLSKSTFYRSSCKGLGLRARYRKNHWALSSSFKVPGILKFDFKTLKEMSYHGRFVLTPFKLGNFYSHFESSFLWKKTELTENFYTSPGISTREETQIIRTGFLSNDSYTVLGFGAKAFLFKHFELDSNYSILSISSKETDDVFNKNLTFPAIDVSLFCNFGLKSFKYDPFKGFYNLKPLNPRLGIFQIGLSFQTINFSDGFRVAPRGETGVEGGNQITYIFALAWKYNKHVKIEGNYFITKSENSKSVSKRKIIYTGSDWTTEADRPISGFAIRAKISL